MSPNTASQYIIPDLLAAWPWHRAKNPALDQGMQDEANSWVASLDLFEARQLNKFKACDFNLLASLVAPIQGRDHLRISCDLMNFYFAYDEYTDVMAPEEVTKVVDEIIKTFRERQITSNLSKIAEMANQFMQRTIALVGEDTQGIDHFIADFEDYAKSVIQEADDRDHDIVRSVEDYFVLRRDTCGGKPSFSFFGLGLYIPKEVFDHPVMQSLTESATDLIAMTNDMHSYALEHARGLDGHNVVTAIITEHAIDLQGAFYWLSGYANRTIHKFLNDRKNLPSWGEDIDNAVDEYINRMGRCVRGYDSWSYETNRYYGKNGLQVQKDRLITLHHRELEMGYITRETMDIANGLAVGA